jgi:hypothetical protein
MILHNSNSRFRLANGRAMPKTQSGPHGSPRPTPQRFAGVAGSTIDDLRVAAGNLAAANFRYRATQSGNVGQRRGGRYRFASMPRRIGTIISSNVNMPVGVRP